tara:strand:+ start:90 stop:392 length:303 start_codon:yes stop_codon:yes gene_type:complete
MLPAVTWTVGYDHRNKTVRWEYKIPLVGVIGVTQTAEQFCRNTPDVLRGLQWMLTHVMERKDKPCEGEEGKTQQMGFDAESWEKFTKGIQLDPEEPSEGL